MLRVENLHKTYLADQGTVRGIQGISFEVKQGEFYTLLGPSGCGKTTTLRCIAGLEQPEQGEIWIGDQLVFSSPRRIETAGHKRDIGMVFQSYAIWPHMDVFNNVAFPIVRGRYRVPTNNVKKRVMEALRLVRLEEFARRPATQLSGGQQQRVALARAVIHQPKVLLLDEPLSNLDAKLREEMRQEFKQFFNRLRITTLYVTHDQTEALAMSDRIAVMQNGSIIQEGTPWEIYASPKDLFTAQFIGRINVFKAQVVQASMGAGLVATAWGQLRCSLPEDVAEGDDVWVAVRPEGIMLFLEKPDLPNNVMTGKLESATFLGDYVECQVKVADHEFQVKADPFTGWNHPSPVYVYLPAERCIVFHIT